MKINEFIKEVNKFAAAKEDKEDGDGIYIAGTQDDLEYDNWFFVIWPKQQIMSKNWDWDCLGTMSPKQLQRLFSLVDELEQTPVKERFPKKKYTIQVIDNPYRFLNRGKDGSYFFENGNQHYNIQNRFTQSEINELKQRNDIAIDWSKAKIKPVEESNDEK